jgi:hypothetical protein
MEGEVAEDVAPDPVLLASCRYCDALDALSLLDEKLSQKCGSQWRRSLAKGAVEGRKAYAVLEMQCDSHLSRTLTTPATNLTGVASKLRLAFCIASDADWSSPVIRQLILSAAEDASHLANGSDRDLDRHYFRDEPSADSLTLARAAIRRLG